MQCPSPSGSEQEQLPSLVDSLRSTLLKGKSHESGSIVRVRLMHTALRVKTTLDKITFVLHLGTMQ